MMAALKSLLHTVYTPQNNLHMSLGSHWAEISEHANLPDKTPLRVSTRSNTDCNTGRRSIQDPLYETRPPSESHLHTGAC